MIEAEERLVIRQILDPDGQRRVEMHLEGTHEESDPEQTSTIAFAIAGAIINLYLSGTIFKYVRGLYGIELEGILKVESDE